MHSQNSMPWERYFGRVTDGIRQERLLSVDSKVLLIWAVQPTNAISKTTVAGVSPLDYIRKRQVSFIEKIDCGTCAAAIGGDSEIENGKFDIIVTTARERSSHYCYRVSFPKVSK